MSPSAAVPDAGNAPIRARISVVLPAPLRPIRPHISPSSIASDTLRMTGTGPIETLRSETLNMRGPQMGPLGAADQRLHLWIGEHRVGLFVRYHCAVVEGQHPIGKAADNIHVVLDEQHGDLSCLERRHHH